MRHWMSWMAIMASVLMSVEGVQAETLKLKLRSIQGNGKAEPLVRVFKEEQWEANQTAVIVCDVWDLHHCLNAVRRLEEFAPRLNDVLNAARDKGAVIIHAPSDCMPAYANHAARRRAIAAPAANKPAASKDGLVSDYSWCSRTDLESTYPIDQSDGGEDDDPDEHAAWAAKLKALGRNPGTPWKTQSSLITIDGNKDYISDRGDEIQNVLQQHGIKNVILTGVHCNMCVLGRPFGLRQMRRHGLNVVLMRDLTDSMYSPKSWPYVDHFTGHDLVIDHVEKTVCATITSDQLLGGNPFRWKKDTRPKTDPLKPIPIPEVPIDLRKQWTLQRPGIEVGKLNAGESQWVRAALFVPEKSTDWVTEGGVSGLWFNRKGPQGARLWVNGTEVAQPESDKSTSSQQKFFMPKEKLNVEDYNLVVLKLAEPSVGELTIGTGALAKAISGAWQVRIGDSAEFSNIPLPAKFGIGPDAVIWTKPISK